MKYYHFLLLMLFSVSTFAQKEALSSPDGNLKLQINLKDSITYSVFLGNETIFENNSLSLVLKDRVLGKQPKLKGKKTEQINSKDKPFVPLKFSTVTNHCNVLTLNFKGDYSLQFRAYNNGIAYRFITGLKQADIEIYDEKFILNTPSNFTAHLQQVGNFKTSYEDAYSKLKTQDFNANTKMATLPALLNTAQDHKILISESDLTDYPAMFLKGIAPNKMKGVFPKAPLTFEDEGDRSVKITSQADYIAKTSGKRNFPWRYFVITKEDKELLVNTMTYNLAESNKIKDPSWIKPGQVSWEWWNGAAPYHVDFESGYNEETYKYFIDFASTFGIPYIVMDEGWAKSTTDPFTPNPDIDLFKLIEYGKKKNVKIVLWLTWLTVEHHFDLFKTFSDWGIAGVKIDFMDRSDQWMVNYYERVVKEAAKYKMFVDFHGSFKPAGLEYAYPNLLSYEGVRGLEQMGGCTVDNSLFLPFIRNAVGPMDFTPGAMINMQPEIYHSDRPNSAAKGTRAFQMALYVAFESGLQMLADNPTNYYQNKECTEFITKVPTTWDETIALDAKAGEYLIVAKRKGDEWFIGAITNGSEQKREFKINLDFLAKNANYDMISFQDGINAGRQAMDYKKQERQVNHDQVIIFTMVRNGGWAARITPKK
ncbi:glycoside hydrolase family 97 protein [Flavobacterium hydrophilum]|uniref:Alpha-glucosidase n=1 Tax=Flavobacterium hydrophilum TaxID=2211445 RepID=A0A2V4C731_9FLAO|nr:glycoside hydrolase family 97 protein [Flavobacterium hydrophilum]PXY46442.1 alpha-glucosidase [Flavobacterium hydrophilum]